MTKDPKEFFKKFAALCEEYKVEFDVREANGYDGMYAEGIDIEFEAIYEDNETVRPYATAEVGMNIDAKSLADESQTQAVSPSWATRKY